MTTFWIAAAALALLIAAILVRAAWRAKARDAVEDAIDADLQVYRDQLAEVDRDLARGLLSEEDAERVRAEVGRRILALDRARAEGRKGGEGPRVIAAIAALAVIAGGAGLYLWLGSPGYPDLGRERRLELAREVYQSRPSQAEAEASAPRPEIEAPERILALMEQLRAVLKDRPDDERGWELLVHYEARLGNFRAAYEALDHLIEIRGGEPSAEDLATRAELMIYAAGGIITPEAEAVLRQALDRDPQNGRALFYMGLLYRQTGRPDIAFRIWRDLLENGPPDAPYVEAVRADIAELAQLAGVRYTPPEAGRGPSSADVAAAADMTAEERQAMVRGMVEGLEERLFSEGGPAADWERLVRSLAVLGEADRARTALERARTALADDPGGLERVLAVARQAGLAE